MRAKLLLGAAAALAIGCATQARADLIVNGGFETGDFTGWTVNADATYVVASGFDGYSPHSGNFFAALGNVGGIGYLSQTFADTTGQSLEISLFLNSNGTTPNEFDIEFNGVTLFDQVNIPDTGDPGPAGYMNLTATVTATGSDTLALSERNDPAYLALDDVSVTLASAVPEPSSLALLGAALAAYGVRRRKRRAA